MRLLGKYLLGSVLAASGLSYDAAPPLGRSGYPEVTYVSSFARCDGTTDDTLALRRAIATGKALWFPPGATCLISSSLTLQSGQVVYGNGATIKSAAQFTTTTTTTITYDVTNQITVASTAGMYVGMDINVLNGTSYDQTNRVISAINGNVITTSTTWRVNVSGTTTVYPQHYQLYASGRNVIRDLKFDGNESNRTTAGRWETTGAIETLPALADSFVRIEHVEIYNQPGEGIVAFGNRTSVVDSYLHDLDGNGVHFSGAIHPLVTGTRVVNVNNDTNVGHADGGIIWSALISDATLIGNYVEDAIACFGSIDAADNSDVTISGNTCRNATYGYEAIHPSGEYSFNVVIDGNRFYSAGIELNQVSTGSANFPQRFVITNNYFEGAIAHHINNARNVTVANNIFYENGQTQAMLQVTSSKHVTISHNQFVGGSVAMYFAGSTLDNVQAVGNVLSGQKDRGFSIASDATGSILLLGNSVANDSTATASYYGVGQPRDKTTVQDNYFVLTKGHSCIWAGVNTTIQGNTCRKGTATYSIRADGGVTGVTMVNNLVDSAVSCAGTCTTRDNDTIP